MPRSTKRHKRILRERRRTLRGGPETEARHGAPSRRLVGHNLEARLLDLTGDGLALETSQALRVGGAYRFRLGGSGGRKVEGTVRWCRLCSTVRRDDGDVLPIYRAGLEIGTIERRPRAEVD